MFPTKCQMQNDCTNLEKISCFYQHQLFGLYFAIKTSIFKLRPLFRFLFLINSSYRRCVSCMYNRYNRSNISNRSNTLNPLDTWYPSNTLNTNTSSTWKSEVSFCMALWAVWPGKPLGVYSKYTKLHQNAYEIFAKYIRLLL